MSITADQLKAWLQCVKEKSHDFSKGDVCARCSAEKGAPSFIDVARHVRVKKENPYAQ